MREEQNRPRRKSLSRQVMKAIENIILEQHLRPGDPLPTEQQIAGELQVSKSSVREAVKMLEALGVVEIRRGLYTVISENPEQGYLNLILSHFCLNSGSTDDLREFRRIVEEAYALQAIKTATEEDISEIRRALEEFQDRLSAGHACAEDDIRFHNQILYATHNPFLITLGVALNQLFSDSIGVSISRHPDDAAADHQRIFQGIVQRKPEIVSSAIAESARHWSLSLPRCGDCPLP